MTLTDPPAARKTSRPGLSPMGLAGNAGFDEVRYFAFASANKQSGFSPARSMR
ncbi:hypothetical protein LJR289_001364 [Pseudoduganella sp. LjRoot289]|uniref:hypothetical protein n=1 Tax=Pseudoduganella sp. LjRoot289 TaxID=3342314 RepID=UPI003ED086CB